MLADPQVLKTVGAAAALLAWVNGACGDGDGCVMKYSAVAEELGVSATTVKAWSEKLEDLGYYSRRPRGPAGVEVQLCSDAWPGQGSTLLKAATEQAVAALEATRYTVDLALRSAVADIRKTLEHAV